MEHKVVAHTRDGRIVKGITHDFDPEEPLFHVLSHEGGGVPTRVRLDELKALFYVRDYFGNRDYKAPKRFGTHGGQGRRVIVTFLDGETVFGHTPDHAEDVIGFTLFPADPEDNNLRIWIPCSAVKELVFA